MWDGVDRRIFARAEYPCLITVRKNTAPTQAILTHTDNISVGGVRVIIIEKIEPMTEVDLEIDLKDTLSTVICRATIAWVKVIVSSQKDKSPRYEMGIRFLGLKDENRRRIQNIVERILGKAS
jgi:c-di-GMP-binding flagellar brake protein YcgR